jgi:hypothetical protein
MYFYYLLVSKYHTNFSSLFLMYPISWGHIRPIQNNNNKDADEIIDEKLIVYAEYDEEYFTFISSEAWRALKDWMNYGEISGELINNYSWVMRDYIKCSLRTFIHQQLNL